LAAKDENQMK